MVTRYLRILEEQKAGRFDLQAFLEARCTLDPDTGCLIWKQAVPPDGVIRATVLNMGGLVVRRLVWQLTNPKSDLGKRRPFATCGNPLCVNPEHIRARTVKEAHRAAVKAGSYSCPVAHAKRAAAARQRRSEDYEQRRRVIQELRQKGLTYREISTHVGLPWRDVGKVLRGEKWSDGTPAANASVFTFRGVA